MIYWIKNILGSIASHTVTAWPRNDVKLTNLHTSNNCCAPSSHSVAYSTQQALIIANTLLAILHYFITLKVYAISCIRQNVAFHALSTIVNINTIFAQNIGLIT